MERLWFLQQKLERRSEFLSTTFVLYLFNFSKAVGFIFFFYRGNIEDALEKLQVKGALFACGLRLFVPTIDTSFCASK